MAERTFSNQLVAVRPTNIHIVTTAAPAAGAESITIVPANEYWILSTWTAVLTASATVANRIASIVIDDGTSILFQEPTAAAQTAGQALRYVAAPLGVTPVANAAVLSVGSGFCIPSGLVLQPGWRVRTITGAIDASDQWGVAKLLVDRFSV